MWWKEFKRYLWLFVLGAVLIVVYKTFDNFGYVLDFGKTLLTLLTPFVIGGCIAYILYIPCRKIEVLCQKTKISFLHKHRRAIAITSIYVIFFATITLLLFAIVPALAKSISDFVMQLPTIFKKLIQKLNDMKIYGVNTNTIHQFLNEHVLSLDKLLSNFTMDNVNRYAKGFMSVGTAVFDILTGIIVSIYLLIDRHNIKTTFRRMFYSFSSEKHSASIIFYGKKINTFIQLYLSCQFLDALIVFILSFIVLALLRVKYPLLLAVIMGSFNLIPYFGAIVATVITALVTIFTKDLTAGLIVAAAMIVLQQIDSNFIQPRLVSGSLQLSPIWVILAVVLGGGLFGALGIFLAVPTFALFRVILLDVLDRREEKNTPKKTIKPEKSN